MTVEANLGESSLGEHTMRAPPVSIFSLNQFIEEDG